MCAVQLRKLKGQTGEDSGSGGGDSPAGQLSTVDHLLSGVEAGVYMVFLTSPLWLIKTRLQIQHNPLPLPASASSASSSTAIGGGTRYKGPFGE